MPKISIIVPVYKVEKYLDRCMTSLVDQTEKDIEIILVDDGSPDTCPALCDEWAKKDGRIKVIHKENGGLGFARNTGLDASTGDYIGFIDSDDYIDLDMYEKLYTAAEKNGADIAMTGFCCVGGVMSQKDDDISFLNCFDKEIVFEGKDGIDSLILDICGAKPGEHEDSKYGFSVVKNLFKASIIKENNIRFLSERKVMSEDVFFILAFLDKSGKAIGIPGGMYKYCRNGESLSKSYRADRYEKAMYLTDEINKFLGERMPEKDYLLYTDRLTQAYSRAAIMQEIQFSKANGLSHKELKERLRNICRGEKLQIILKRYPWRKLPVKQAIFAFAMKHSFVSIMILLVRLREGK